MNLTYMIHPNNHLTKLDNFTIPNMESYSKKLSEQIQTLERTKSSPNLTITNSQSTEIAHLLEYKTIEKNYILSYLKVLKLLETVDQRCCKDDYDYEAEDRILDSIEVHMNEFKKMEARLKSLQGGVGASPTTDKGKTFDTGRKQSLQVEQEFIENVDVDTPAGRL